MGDLLTRESPPTPVSCPHLHALIWLAAVTILLMTARKTYRLVTVLPSPARQAGQAAIWLALIMSEVVIALLA